MKTKTYEVMCGNAISNACTAAVGMAKRDNCNVEFDFNGEKIVATPDSDPAMMEKTYFNEIKRRQAEYIASPEYKQKRDDAKLKQQEHDNALKDALVASPEHMSLRDKEAWESRCAVNSDPYGSAVNTYAERWACLMEAQLNKGEKLSDIADKCSHLANNGGITGFMYGCAVSILAKVWKHGEDLRRWHNLKTQIHDEGERANKSGNVLNPAILTIS